MILMLACGLFGAGLFAALLRRGVFSDAAAVLLLFAAPALAIAALYPAQAAAQTDALCVAGAGIIAAAAVLRKQP